MAAAIHDLESLNVTGLISGQMNIDDLEGHRFERTYQALLNVIQRRDSKKFQKAQRQAAAAKRAKDSSSRPVTPANQATLPANPSASGSTIESKDEESAKNLLNSFLADTMGVLQREVRELKWRGLPCFVEMNRTYEPCLSARLTLKDRDTTVFRLGTRKMTVINDGGLGLVYNDGSGRTEFQPSTRRPLLSLEV